MTRGVLISVFVLFGLVCFAQANAREQLRSNCRIIPQYVSGPGSLEDALNRWVSYFAVKGKFFLPEGKQASTPESYKEEYIKEWGDYRTFNHVYYVEEPQIHNDMCTFTAYHAFLAWDGKCGPLIRKTQITMQLDARAKITYFHELTDTENAVSLINSCKGTESGPGEAATEGR